MRCRMRPKFLHLPLGLLLDLAYTRYRIRPQLLHIPLNLLCHGHSFLSNRRVKGYVKGLVKDIKVSSIMLLLFQSPVGMEMQVR